MVLVKVLGEDVLRTIVEQMLVGFQSWQGPLHPVKLWTSMGELLVNF